jgi:hypothetical protein
MIALPPWINRDDWAGWVEMRRKLKKPLTDRAAMRALVRLDEMRAKGHDPNASLRQSEDYCWQDLFPPKQREAIEQATRPEDTRAGVEAIAASKGLPKWDECEQWDVYRRRVLAPLRRVA